VSGCCEHGNDPPGSIKVRECLDHEVNFTVSPISFLPIKVI
jgi:hypothetical protein